MPTFFNVPSADTPFLNEQGLVSTPWYMFLIAIFQNSGSGAAGSVNQVLHGNSAGFSAVSLTADVAGRLALSNFVRSAAGQVIVAQGVGVDSAYKTLSGDAILVSSGAVTVQSVSGVTFGAPNSGNLLVGSGTAWATKTLSGDGTLVSTGAVTITKTNGLPFGALATLTSGITVTVTTAPLTGLGSQGTMTFVSGALTAQVQST